MNTVVNNIKTYSSRNGRGGVAMEIAEYCASIATPPRPLQNCIKKTCATAQVFDHQAFAGLPSMEFHFGMSTLVPPMYG